MSKTRWQSKYSVFKKSWREERKVIFKYMANEANCYRVGYLALKVWVGRVTVTTDIILFGSKCKLIPQISMCLCVNGLGDWNDKSDPLFSTSSKCWRKRSPKFFCLLAFLGRAPTTLPPKPNSPSLPPIQREGMMMMMMMMTINPLFKHG